MTQIEAVTSCFLEETLPYLIWCLRLNRNSLGCQLWLFGEAFLVFPYNALHRRPAHCLASPFPHTANHCAWWFTIASVRCLSSV